MVYRKHAREIGEVPTEADPQGTLVRFDASGATGRQGQHGHSGADGGYSGASGSRGGDAGPAQRGRDGGTLLVELEPGGDATSALVQGDLRLSDGRAKGLREIVSFERQGYVDLLACGGRGGHGGHGGRGGDGARGSSGSDATRYSSGSDGGPGGRGGDGGSASSGADGGGGGRIVVTVDEAQTHLLMLVRQNVRGGDGGQPGKNGSGGSGGPGGRGGSSYSWTETESYTDANGNSQTRTHFRSNPGGSDGRSGSSGSSGNALVVQGRRGKDGSFTIMVEGAEGEREYPSRYEVRLAELAHASANVDAIYEPGERVKVSGLAVDNIGGMPTPGASDVEVRLEQRGWIIPDEAHAVLPRSIPSQHRQPLADELWFTIGDYRPHGPDDPLAVPEVIRVRADLPAVRREFERFDKTTKKEMGRFVIGFPVEVTPIESLRALAPGEAARLRFAITNTSKKPLGIDTEGARRLSFTLAAHQSELGDEHAALFDEAGERLSLDDGWTVEIERLDPGETREVEVSLGFTRTAPLYRSLALRLTLELGFLDRPAELRPVQYRAFEARVASRYRHDPGADLLLVVNHRTTREELDAWQQLARELGLRPAVWDLSLQGGFDLDRSVEGGGCLGDHFEGASMVVLNNDVQTPSAVMSAHRVVGKEQCLLAAERGIDVLFVGNDVGIKHLLTPTGPAPDLPESLPPADELSTALVKTDEPTQEPSFAVVHGWDFWRNGPDPVKLEKAALRVSQRLAAERPNDRCLVVHHHETSVADKTLWVRKWRLGHLEVWPTLGTEAGHLQSVEVPEVQLHDPDFVRSDDNLTALVMTRSFDEKLDLLHHALERAADEDDEHEREPAELVALLVDTMLVDLAQELRGLHEFGWWSGLDRERMAAAMPRLSALAQLRLDPTAARLAPGSPAGVELARLVAWLKTYVGGEVGFWEWLPPFLFLRRAPAIWWLTRGFTNAMLKSLYAPEEGDELAEADLKEAKKYVDVQERQLRAEFASHCEELGTTTNRSMLRGYMEDQLYRPLSRRGVTSDAEVFVDASSRVLSSKDLGLAISKDVTRAERRSSMLRRAASARDDLRLSRSTEELLG